MNDALKIILYSSAAGLPIIIGGTISSFFQAGSLVIKDEVNHWRKTSLTMFLRLPAFEDTAYIGL